ncbi:trans isomerase PIN4 [Seminavis robusta]|uniref:Peptidyl-prolyl cis-trans isomerase n=1 Tax=Seminavis robusta TaxID=568900 RepID=A0A9N8HDM7_9STRA|nr:trans isomerase PIN4 [Seminavis robusta]|eukprot:Sro468_g149120.1 trans isomerase PIN4 (161) ;mRNA; r:26210-26947
MKSVLTFLVTFLALTVSSYGFQFLAPRPPASYRVSSGRTFLLQMGLFDGIAKAFQNEEFAAPPEGIKATARHILCKSKDDADMVLDKINQGGSFASLASEYSSCPSKSQGGSLGSFRPGVMVPEFDKVIFDPETELNQVVGPVATPFGYHLILVEKRTGV